MPSVLEISNVPVDWKDRLIFTTVRVCRNEPEILSDRDSADIAVFKSSEPAATGNFQTELSARTETAKTDRMQRKTSGKKCLDMIFSRKTLANLFDKFPRGSQTGLSRLDLDRHLGAFRLGNHLSRFHINEAVSQL